MGNTCGGYCGGIGKGAEDYNYARPSVHNAFESEDQIICLIKLQANIKGYIARKKYRRYLEDSDLLSELYPDTVVSVDNLVPYQSETVQEVKKAYGEFRYEDHKS